MFVLLFCFWGGVVRACVCYCPRFVVYVYVNVFSVVVSRYVVMVLLRLLVC